MSKRTCALGLLLAGMLFFSASCSGVAATPAPVSFKVEWSLWQGDYSLLVADQMGFFKTRGLAIESIRYDSATQAISDLAGAKLDGGLFTMSDTLLAASVADIRAVLVSDSGGQYSIVATPGIKSVQQLRGKRIGLARHSSGEMFVSYMLENVRMTPDDVTYVEMPPDQVLKGLPNQIDAGLVWEPYTTEALKQGQVIVYQSALQSTLIPKLLIFRKTFVDQHPEAIRAFISAWWEAVDYRIRHPQESLAIITKATGQPAGNLVVPEDITLYTLNDNRSLFGNRVGKDPSSIYYIARFNRSFLISIGYMTNPPDVTTLLDPSYQQ
jgi:NitT/TauT family transport system substrate-binding protein